VRVPTSVLLAVLAAAGLLALAPALVRRYDATERLVAERASSTARVLERRRRRRTVPGRHPVNTARVHSVTVSGSVRGADSPATVAGPAGAAAGPGAPEAGPTRPGADSAAAGAHSAAPVSAPPASRLRAVSGRRPGTGAGSGLGAGRRRTVAGARTAARRGAPLRDRRRHRPAVYRRRRVFASLVLLNLVELVGVLAVGPGFWISFAVTAALLVAYTAHLRNRALRERRRRRLAEREAAWLAARQAEVRREQARRAAARRENQRRLAAQREAVRRAALGMDRDPDLPAAASGGGSVFYRRAGGLRGRAYQAGRSGRHTA